MGQGGHKPGEGFSNQTWALSKIGPQFLTKGVIILSKNSPAIYLSALVITRIHTRASARLTSLIHQELLAACGHLSPRRIVLKPNWVLHETDPEFPIRALVTDPKIIEAVAEACLDLFPGAESILVADCPLQYADWPRMCEQSGLLPIMERLQKKSSGKIVFRDLRKEVFAKNNGSFLTTAQTEHGDPRGYRIVSLGARSHLEAISDQADRFAVNDYNANTTRSNHERGTHQYYVSQSILDADLLINLPKWKAHQKSAITAALKNLVGINGDKAYLPHFRRGAPKWGGDEYRDENRWLYWAQTTLRERFQKKSRLLYSVLKPGWELLKKVRGIETRLDHPSAQPKNFYIAGGAWHGNDTLWRMIYDLNLVIQCADAQGQLQKTRQRHCFTIVDGLIAGEGNGPLEPFPRETDWLICGDDPFAVDAALCYFMGFNPAKVPVIAERKVFTGVGWGQFDLKDLAVELDGTRTPLLESPINFRFAPPPGWRNYVER
jgi:uncharacterized protein (DUF362 family)